jgi:hypothetical protein
MKLIDTDKESVRIEFSREEFHLLAAVLYSSDQFFEGLDASLYNLKEEEVTTLANKIEEIQAKMPSGR